MRVEMRGREVEGRRGGGKIEVGEGREKVGKGYLSRRA